ncbi:hypothetical protein PMAYCL1PPCAC_23485 [Pristionchus mayeri]|uniref:Uncharacterized protein n=1 Tax=Pristionchus mayeri TaxID=1317129 RepID=A0AAN5CZW9_9BILA|nr:hypothetical protein PMAYCL1PPCAC_23485 [Pristionchus mayeri]
MGENGEESSAERADLDKRAEEKAEGVSYYEEGQVKEEKKTSDAILDELFSTIKESGKAVDVAEAITEVSKSRRERATRDKSRSRSRSRDRKHKHKKNKKEKKPKKHLSRSRSNDRKRRHRSNSSSPTRFGKTGTLADIRINTKTKNLNDLKNTVPVSSTMAQEEDDDDLPVGADYRTVMAEAVAASEPSTSQGPSLADLPTTAKMQPAFPLKKSDGGKKDAPEEKSNPMLKKVISEKGGALLVPRKIQIEASKNNGSSVDSFGPALPPATRDDSKDEDEEEVEMAATLAIKSPTKIAFGQISLKVNGGSEKKKEDLVRKGNIAEKMDVDENKKEAHKVQEKKDEKNEDNDKKAAKKMAVRRRRSTSVDDKKKEKKDRKRSRSRSKERRNSDRSRDKGREGRRDGGRSSERRGERRDERRRSRSRSAERRRVERERDRRSRRSRSREKGSRSKERSKSREKIDKKKLLEIALQNAKGVSGPVAEKQGVNMKILEKAGGRNIGDIVSYCQKLSETENAEKSGGGRDSDEDDFSYRSKKEIKMNIPGSKQLPTSTPQERLLDTAPLRAAFPVSSGVIHRDNTKDSASEWKKVDPSSGVPSVCTPAQKKLVAISSLNKKKAESEGRMIQSAFPILPPPPAPPTIRGDLIPPPPTAPLFNPASLMPPPPMPPTIITPAYDRLINMPDSGHDEDSRSVGRKMEERSKIVNRLIKDPNDCDAMKRLSQIDDSLNNLGKSAELSGKWMGHTRVNLLSGDELQPHDPRFHAWVKKDLFKNTMPVVSGVGMKLMQKMGWNPGEGLGRENQGDTLPLVLDVKSDRKGLYSEGYDKPLSKGKSKGAKKSGGMKASGGEGAGGGGGGGLSEEKNPISVFMELTQSKKWEQPVFDFQSRGGLVKTFSCSVKVNGFEFIGPVCASKKAAKTECARVALEKIGFAAPNVQTPVVYDPSSSFSIPEQIVQARVRSALEAAELCAMPPPASYVAPLEMAGRPPEKYDPAQIQAMQEERKKNEPQPVPPAPIQEKEKETAAPTAPPRQTGRGRGRGRGGRGGRGMDRGGYYPDGPYPPPPHLMRGGPSHGHYPTPPFPHHPGMEYQGHYEKNDFWEDDFTQDPDPSNSRGAPSYSSFPSGPFASRPSVSWVPDDEFQHGGGVSHYHPPPPPHRGHREHSPAFEPYQHPPRFF